MENPESMNMQTQQQQQLLETCPTTDSVWTPEVSSLSRVSRIFEIRDWLPVSLWCHNIMLVHICFTVQQVSVKTVC